MTPYLGIVAEERGQAEAIARNLYEMFNLKTQIIVIVIGEGASGGALGIGIGDRIMMLENTWYSVISPESCSSILWRLYGRDLFFKLDDSQFNFLSYNSYGTVNYSKLEDRVTLILKINLLKT